MEIIIQKQDIKTEDYSDLTIDLEQIEDTIELVFENTRLIIPLEAFFGIFHTTKEIKKQD